MDQKRMHRSTPRRGRRAAGVGMALALLTALAAVAQPAPPSANDNENDDVRRDLATVEGEIVVTSTLPELATEVELPGREVADSGSSDVAEFFRGVGGLTAIRRGPINLEPSVRGLQEEQVALFVDGTRTFAAGPGRMDSGLSHVAPRMVQNLRVVKGPYALTWGAGALSAVEAETFRPSFSADGFELGGTASATYGENAGRTDAYAGVWGGGEKLRFYLGAGRRTGDDYQAGDGTLVPADYTSGETRWRFGYQPGAHWLAEYSGGYQEQNDIDYPGRLLDATYFYARSHALELTWYGDGGAVSEVYGQLYLNHKDHLMNNDEKPTARPVPGRTPPFAIDVALPAQANTEGGRFRVEMERGELEWTFGLDTYRVEQTATRTVSRRDNGRVLFADIVWPDAEIEDLGGYAQLLVPLGRHRLGATVRFDSFDAAAGDLSPFFLANTSGTTDLSDSHVSAALSGQLRLGSRWTLSTGVGRAVRAPTALELYSDRLPSTRFQLAAEFLGNPDLQAETSLEFNVGARASYGDLLIQVDTFYRRIDDYITVDPDPTLPRRLPLSPPVVFRYVNGSEATFYGGEMLVSQRLSDLISWRGALSYIRGTDEELDEPVLGLPPLHGELGVRVHPLRDRLWVDFAVKVFDRQDRVATSRFEQETPGYTIYDLRSEYRVNDTWTVIAGVENLTDRRYADHLNSPNPFTGERVLEIGRNVRLGFEVDF